MAISKEDKRLFRKAQKGDTEARNALVMRNTGLVYQVVNRLHVGERMEDDAIQMGMMALMRAVELFDVNYGTRFSTYACNSIRRRVLDWVWENQGVITVPKHSSCNESKMQYVVATRHPFRLQHKQGGNTIDLVDHRGEYEPVADCEKLKRLETLPERTAFIIRERIAGRTFQEVSKQVGLTRERVRQIQNDGLRKLYDMEPENRGGGKKKRKPKRKEVNGARTVQKT